MIDTLKGEDFVTDRVYFGIDPQTKKWRAQIKLASGRFISTPPPGFETREELKRVVFQWFKENNIEFEQAN